MCFRAAIAGAIIAMAGASLAAAQTSQPPFSEPREPVVITASGMAQPITDAIPHTTVITETEIRRSGQTDLPGLLRGMAGFELAQSGGHGTQSTAFMRGSAGRQVLVLVDGVRAGALTTGAGALEQVMLDEIERVEIVRGNVSALYGSGAVGGVIQIFTKRGHGEPTPHAALEVGSERSRHVAAGYRGALQNTDFSLSASHFSTAGQSAIDPALAPGANPDRDGYTNNSVSASVVQRVATDHELSARLYHQQGRAAFDDAFATPADVHRQWSGQSSLALGWNATLQPQWQSRVLLGAYEDRSDSALNSGPREKVRTRSTQLGWTHHFALGTGHTVSAGLSTMRQRLSSDIAFEGRSRRTHSATLGYNAEVGALQLQANLRHDEHSDVGGATTGLLGAGWRLTESLKLLGTLSSAFNAPTFNDLYYPGFNNPNLKPERARSTELGLQYAAGSVLARLSWFRTRYRDLVDYAPPAFTPVNVARARVQGVELTTSAELAGWRWRAGATVQQPEDGNGERLVRRARHYGSVDVGREFGQWRVQAQVVASGNRPDFDTTLGGYTLFNLSGGYRVAPGLWLTARVTNLSDHLYATVYTYPAPGRELYAGVAWNY
jgi:vitamin B12 transporter